MTPYSLYLRIKIEKMIMAKCIVVLFGIFLIGVGFFDGFSS